jgi:hypothetical protein
MKKGLDGGNQHYSDELALDAVRTADPNMSRASQRR